MLKRVYGYLSHDPGENAPDASRQLETEGYCVLQEVFNSTEVKHLADEIEGVFRDQPADKRAGDKRSEEEDECYRYAMLNRSALAQKAIGHQQIVATLAPLLGEDFHIIANTAWRNAPNSELDLEGRPWHIDAGPHVPLPKGSRWPREIPHPVFAVGVHIFLRDCELADGPTGVIPGSHFSGRFPPFSRVMDPDLSFEDQGVVPLLARAGDVAMFVSDLWHRRMPTLPDNNGRFFLQAHYGRRDIAQRLKTTSEANQLSAAAITRAVEYGQPTLAGLHEPRFYDG